MSGGERATQVQRVDDLVAASADSRMRAWSAMRGRAHRWSKEVVWARHSGSSCSRPAGCLCMPQVTRRRAARSGDSSRADRRLRRVPAPLDKGSRRGPFRPSAATRRLRFLRRPADRNLKRTPLPGRMRVIDLMSAAEPVGKLRDECQLSRIGSDGHYGVT
jgi:hypothetical protein